MRKKLTINKQCRVGLAKKIGGNLFFFLHPFIIDNNEKEIIPNLQTIFLIVYKKCKMNRKFNILRT